MPSEFDAEFEEFAAPDLDAAFGQAATFTEPPPGLVIPCTVTVLDAVTEEETTEHGHRRNVTDVLIKVRRSEVASPQMNATIAITGGDTYAVRGVASQDETYTVLQCVRTARADSAARDVVERGPAVTRRRR